VFAALVSFLSGFLVGQWWVSCADRVASAQESIRAREVPKGYLGRRSLIDVLFGVWFFVTVIPVAACLATVLFYNLEGYFPEGYFSSYLGCLVAVPKVSVLAVGFFAAARRAFGPWPRVSCCVFAVIVGALAVQPILPEFGSLFHGAWGFCYLHDTAQVAASYVMPWFCVLCSVVVLSIAALAVAFWSFEPSWIGCYVYTVVVGALIVQFNLPWFVPPLWEF
jgi:hypothetical protein